MGKISNKKRLKRKPVRKSNMTLLLVISAILLFSTFAIVYQSQRAQDLRGRAQTNNCSVSDDQLTIDAEEQKLLALINDYRSQNGSQPLKFSSSLNRAAAWMSNDTYLHSSPSHTDSLGRDVAARLTDCGVDMKKQAEEILARGSSVAQTVLNAWKASSPHNAAMLRSTHKTIGIGRTNTYWAVDFSASLDSGSEPLPLAPTGTTGTQPTPPNASPTFYCLGPCPTATPTVILATPTITSATPTTTQLPINATSTPSPTLGLNEPTSNPQPTNIDQPTTQPIITGQPIKNKNPLGRFLRMLFDLIKKFIELLLALFGLGRK